MPIFAKAVSAFVALSFSGAGLAGTERETVFIQTLARLPIVQSCLFKRSIPIDNGKFEEHYIHARTQSGAFYHRELEKIADLDFLDPVPHGQFLSRFTTNYWGVDGRKLFMYSGPESEEIHLVRSARMKQRTVHRLLTMGVGDLASVHWRDRHFDGVLAGPEALPVHGKLEVDGDGDPQILNYSLRRGAKEERRRIRYFYSPGLRFQGLPYKIMTYELQGQVETLLEVFEIFELAIATEPLPESWFNPDLLTPRGVAPTYQRGFLSTNGVSFEIQAPALEITCPR